MGFKRRVMMCRLTSSLLMSLWPQIQATEIATQDPMDQLAHGVVDKVVDRVFKMWPLQRVDMHGKIGKAGVAGLPYSPLRIARSSLSLLQSSFPIARVQPVAHALGPRAALGPIRRSGPPANTQTSFLPANMNLPPGMVVHTADGVFNGRNGHELMVKQQEKEEKEERKRKRQQRKLNRMMQGASPKAKAKAKAKA